MNSASSLACDSSDGRQQAERAVRTRHLTARACDEIANAANVQQLAPTHFSRRYEDIPERVYAEAASACSRTLVPK